MRENLTLECKECKRRNYRTSREMRGGSKLELKKYCRFCKTHTAHVERRT